jgi:glutamyl-tRNA reductase
MSMLLLGLNHRTAPVEVRERLAFSREGAANALLLFRKLYSDAQCLILSTCNRVEILVETGSALPRADDIIEFLAQARDIPAELFRAHLYCHEGADAVRHFLRVISGLDSMVLGESQIVNQIKQAYMLAQEQGTLGPVMHRLVHHAFGVSKRVRSETEIAEGRLSMASVAVESLRERLPDLAKARVLVIGAGEMAQLACKYLNDAGAENIKITTRTFLNAKALAEVCRGQAVSFVALEEHLAEADAVITATSSPTAVLTRQRVERMQAARESRPVLLVDLSVPRNIEADVTKVAGVQLLDVDTLGREVAEHERQRAEQSRGCEVIIEEETAAFQEWSAQSHAGPLIDQMYRDVRELANQELRRLFAHCADLSPRHQQSIEEMAQRLVGKLMHPCVLAVRQEAKSAPTRVLASAFQALRAGFSPENASKEGSACRPGSALERLTSV